LGGGGGERPAAVAPPRPWAVGGTGVGGPKGEAGGGGEWGGAGEEAAVGFRQRQQTTWWSLQPVTRFAYRATGRSIGRSFESDT
jgi:hypothetical protein